MTGTSTSSSVSTTTRTMSSNQSSIVPMTTTTPASRRRQSPASSGVRLSSALRERRPRAGPPCSRPHSTTADSPLRESASRSVARARCPATHAGATPGRRARATTRRRGAAPAGSRREGRASSGRETATSSALNSLCAPLIDDGRLTRAREHVPDGREEPLHAREDPARERVEQIVERRLAERRSCTTWARRRTRSGSSVNAEPRVEEEVDECRRRADEDGRERAR